MKTGKTSIFKCLKPYLWLMLICFVFIAVDCYLELTLPTLMARIVGEGIEGGNREIIIQTGVTMAIMAFGACACAIMNILLSGYIGSGFGAKLRKGIFSSLQTFSFKNIDKFSVASLSTRMTNDVRRVQDTVVMSMRMLVRVPMMLIFALFRAISLNASLAQIFYVVVPLIILVAVILIPITMPLFALAQKGVDRVNRDVRENITNVRVVKSFVREEYEKDKFNESSDALCAISMKANKRIAVAFPMLMLILNASIIAVWYVGGTDIIGAVPGGIESAATLTAFINYIMHVLMSLMMAAMLLVMLTSASASIRRVREVLKTEPDLVESPDAVSPELVGKVEFDHVCFKYSDEDAENVLSDISFTANPGETVAIIGGTGAGKTTLVHLIPRLYDVTEGSVRIDGYDVRDLSYKSLRTAVGMVMQNNLLFSGTIRENLLWGKPDATEEEIIAAATNAQIHSFIDSLPDKYDSTVEQGGTNYSGGQKQRLCIARAMIKKPAILILDDSTSAVDTATERKIRESFDAVLKNTTTLIIAQRISSVMDADRIIVLDDGRIVGQGKHDELLKDCDTYREIYASQTKRGENADV